MANKDLTKGIDVLFADGVKRQIKPLTIRQLRKFMEAVKDLNTTTMLLDDEQIDKMVNAASIALEKADPNLAADKQALEDALDIKCFNDLLSVAMGADPNS